MSSDDKLIHAALYWFDNAYRALREAGGDPDLLLSHFPLPLLTTLIRNNIVLVHAPQ